MNKSISIAKRRLRASLKAQGQDEKAIEQVIRDTFGGSDGPKLQSIPRTVTRNMLGLFNKGGRGLTLAVSWGKTGKFKVFTDKGYKALMASGQRLGSSNKGRKAAPIGAHSDKK